MFGCRSSTDGENGRGGYDCPIITSKRLFYLGIVLYLLVCSGLLVIMYPYNEVLHNMPSFTKSTVQMIITTYAMTAMSIGLFILTVVNLIGVIKNSPRVLTVLSTLLVIIFLGEVALWGYIYFNHNVKETFALDRIDSRISNPNSRFWDNLQKDFQCCGINGPQDWIPYKITPASCCSSIPKDGICTEFYAYRDGCYKPLKSIITQYTLTINFYAIGSCLVQILVILVAWNRRLFMSDEEFTDEMAVTSNRNNYVISFIALLRRR